MGSKEKIGLPQDLVDLYSVPARGTEELIKFDGLLIYAPKSTKVDMVIGNPASNIAIITGWESPKTAINPNALDVFGIISPVRTPYGLNLMIWNLMANPHIDTVQLGGWSQNDNTDVGERAAGMIAQLFDSDRGLDDEGKVIDTNFTIAAELSKSIFLQDGTVLSPSTIEEEGYEINDDSIVHKAGEIIGTGFRSIDLIRERLRQITFLNMRQSSYNEVLSQAKQHLKVEAENIDSLPRIILPEITINAPDTFPSEIGIQVRTEDDEPYSLVNTWLGYIKAAIHYGDQTPLEHLGAEVRELMFFEAVLDTSNIDKVKIPDWLAEYPDHVVTPESLEDYYQRLYRQDSYMQEIYPGVFKFVNPEPEKYLYAELMFAYPRDPLLNKAIHEMAAKTSVADTMNFLQENQAGAIDKADVIAHKVIDDDKLDHSEKVDILLEIYRPPVNQYQILVDRLKNSPEDADKMMVLWEVPVHGVRDHKRPCFVLFNALVRNGFLHGKGTYRSNDMGTGWLGNAYSTARLLQDMAKDAGLKPGELGMRSESAHIYNIHLDAIKDIYKKQIEEKRPSRKWNEKEADPRGNIRVSVEGNKILVVLIDPETSAPLKEFEGRDFRDITAQLNHWGSMSQTSHAMDIGMQVMSADLSIRLGRIFDLLAKQYGLPTATFEYTQDRPVGILAEVNKLASDR